MSGPGDVEGEVAGPPDVGAADDADPDGVVSDESAQAESKAQNNKAARGVCFAIECMATSHPA